jgi:H+/Cl- antiporter ClcA
VIVFALPLAGLALGVLYERFGKAIKGGNNLVIDTIHDDGPEIPLRMAPMVLVGTVLTHLFGGSAGREGTAVQMGASLADAIAHRLARVERRAPTAPRGGRRGRLRVGVRDAHRGAVFGLEFVVLGRIEYDALIPALVAALVGDMTTRALGRRSHALPRGAPRSAQPACSLKWLVFAAAVAAVSTAFIELTHWLKRQGERRVPSGLGCACSWAARRWWASGSSSGTERLPGPRRADDRARVRGPDLPVYAFALKLLFTAITLGAGFLGGEVTPLFFVGAALGSVLARALGLPLPLGAGVGSRRSSRRPPNAPLALPRDHGDRAARAWRRSSRTWPSSARSPM